MPPADARLDLAIPAAARVERLAAWGLQREPDAPDAPVASKNANWLCRDAASGERYLVKLTPYRTDTGVAYEGRVFEALAAIGAGLDGALSVPAVRGFDPDLGMLAVRWEPAETLFLYHRRTGRYPDWLARALGRALAELHAESRRAWPEAAPAHNDPFVGPGATETLLYVTPAAYARLSRAGMAFFKDVHDDDRAYRELHALRQAPHVPCLLHGDLKHANVLRLGAGRAMLIDWEIASWGDAALDLGYLVANYAMGYLAPRFEGEAIALEALQRFLATLLGAYRHRRGRAFPVERDFPFRVMRWAAVALLLYVYTRTHYDQLYDERSSRLTAHALAFLREPHRWAWELLAVAP
jgi:thiamine kinase-like enzyme